MLFTFIHIITNNKQSLPKELTHYSLSPTYSTDVFFTGWLDEPEFMPTFRLSLVQLLHFIGLSTGCYAEILGK